MDLNNLTPGVYPGPSLNPFSKLTDKELLDYYNATKIQEVILVAMTLKRDLTAEEYRIWIEANRNIITLELEIANRFPNFKQGEFL